MNEFYKMVKDSELSLIEEDYKGIILGFVKMLMARLDSSKDNNIECISKDKTNVINKKSAELNNNVLISKLEEYKESLRLKEYSKNTIESYVCDITQWIDFVKSRNITIINKDCMIEYSKYIYDNYKNKSVNRKIVAINRFLNYLGYQELKIAEYSNVDKDKVYPHAFRYLFSSRFMETIGDISKLSNILGHSSLMITQIYLRRPYEELREKLDMLGL